MHEALEFIITLGFVSGILIGGGASVGIPKVWNILKPKLKDYIKKIKNK